VTPALIDRKPRRKQTWIDGPPDLRGGDDTERGYWVEAPGVTVTASLGSL
jgi:hypothetical protein